MSGSSLRLTHRENKPFLHSPSRTMPSTSLLVAVAMPSRLPHLPFFALLSFSLRRPGSVSPALLPLFGCPAVLPGPPVLVVSLSPLAVAGRHAASLPAFLVPVPVAPVAPVAVLLLPLLTLHVTQGCAAKAMLHARLRRLAWLLTARTVGFLMVMVVVAIIMGCAAVVVYVLPPIFLIQR